MIEKRRKRCLIQTTLIFLLFQSYLNQSVTVSAYSKTWKQSDDSELEITISSYITNLVVDTKYTYKIVLKANNFGSSLDGFYSIAVGLRFTSPEEIIKSDLKCDIGDLSAIYSKIHVLIPLTIPSAKRFSLSPGESIQGQLQYIIYYSEQSKDWDKSEMAPNQWPHESDVSLGWETISQGKITNPYLNFKSTVTIALVTILLGSGIFLYLYVRKRKNMK